MKKQTLIALILLTMMAVNVQGLTEIKLTQPQDIMFTDTYGAGGYAGVMRVTPNINIDTLTGITSGTVTYQYCSGDLTIFQNFTDSMDYAPEDTRQFRINHPKQDAQYHTNSTFSNAGTCANPTNSIFYNTIYCTDPGTLGTLLWDQELWYLDGTLSLDSTSITMTIADKVFGSANYTKTINKLEDGTGVVLYGNIYIAGMSRNNIYYDGTYDQGHNLTNATISFWDNQVDSGRNIAYGDIVPNSTSIDCGSLAEVEVNDTSGVDIYDIYIALDIGNNDGIVQDYKLYLFDCDDKTNFYGSFSDRLAECTNMLGTNQTTNANGIYVQYDVLLPKEVYMFDVYKNYDNKYNRAVYTEHYDDEIYLNPLMPDKPTVNNLFVFLDKTNDDAYMTGVEWWIKDNGVIILNGTNTGNPTIFTSTEPNMQLTISARKENYKPVINDPWTTYIGGGIKHVDMFGDTSDNDTPQVYVEGYIVNTTGDPITTNYEVQIHCTPEFNNADQTGTTGHYNFTNIVKGSFCTLGANTNNAYISSVENVNLDGNKTGVNITLTPNVLNNQRSTNIKVFYKDINGAKQPIEFAKVTIDDGIVKPMTKDTDETGYVFFDGLFIGRTYNVMITADGYKDKEDVLNTAYYDEFEMQLYAPEICLLSGVAVVRYKNHSIKEYIETKVTIKRVTGGVLATTYSDETTGLWDYTLKESCKSPYEICYLYNGKQYCGEIIVGETGGGTTPGENPDEIEILIEDTEQTENNLITWFWEALILWIPMVYIIFILFILLILKKVGDEFSR